MQDSGRDIVGSITFKDAMWLYAAEGLEMRQKIADLERELESVKAELRYYKELADRRAGE